MILQTNKSICNCHSYGSALLDTHDFTFMATYYMVLYNLALEAKKQHYLVM